MKRFVRCTSFVLALLMLMVTPAFAAESRSSNYFTCSSVYLYKTSSTSFEVWFEVDAVGIMDQLGASVIKVQRSSDGENWMTMRTYTKEGYSNMICENTGCHASCVKYGGTTGYYYRAYIILYAKKGTGTGEWIKYTPTLKL